MHSLNVPPMALSCYMSKVVTYPDWKLLCLTRKERVELWVKRKSADISKVQMNTTISRSTGLMTSMPSYTSENTWSHSQ